jgi:enamine deaminase RidA (YjgF/YER057c/UK114 family)
MPATRDVHLFNPEGSPPTAGYSHVASVKAGRIVYFAGQTPQDAAGNQAEGFRAQVEQVFRNLDIAVQAAGGAFHDIIKLNFYCVPGVDPKEMAAVPQVRDSYVDTANPPASTFVYVARLVRPHWLIEIEAVAVVPE